MDILVLNPFFHPYLGGTEKHIHEIGRRLAKRHNISVLTARLEGTDAREDIDGIEVIRCPARVFYTAPHPIPPPVPVFFGFDQMFSQALAGKRIVHMHNRFVFSARQARIAKARGCRPIITLHNARPERIDVMTDLFGSLYDELIGKGIMRSCDGVSAVSGATLDSTMPKDYRGRMEVIHNGVDEKIFRPDGGKGIWPERFESAGLEGPIVLTNARLLPQKGLHHLIDAMQGADASLVVFGRGPLESALKTRARSRKVRTLFLTERIPDSDLSSLYRTCDIFCLPSLYEPCAVALLEAMASALPIMASDAGGNPELVSDGCSGSIFKAGSAKAIRTSLDPLLQDRRSARKLGDRARERVLSEFTWDIAARRFERFYRYFSG